MKIFYLKHVVLIVHLGEVFALWDVAALVLLFERVCYLSVFS